MAVCAWCLCVNKVLSGGKLLPVSVYKHELLLGPLPCARHCHSRELGGEEPRRACQPQLEDMYVRRLLFSSSSNLFCQWGWVGNGETTWGISDTLDYQLYNERVVD